MRSVLKTAAGVLLVAFCLLSCNIPGIPGNAPNADGSKLKEVEAIWNTLPRHAGMQEVNNSRMSKPTSVLVSKHFKSTAGFEEVKDFYLKMLPNEGWQLVEDKKMYDWGRDFGGRYIAFRKGPHKFSIQYAGTANDDWDYGMGVSWDELPDSRK